MRTLNSNIFQSFVVILLSNSTYYSSLVLFPQSFNFRKKTSCNNLAIVYIALSKSGREFMQVKRLLMAFLFVMSLTECVIGDENVNSKYIYTMDPECKWKRVL